MCMRSVAATGAMAYIVSGERERDHYYENNTQGCDLPCTMYMFPYKIYTVVVLVQVHVHVLVQVHVHVLVQVHVHVLVQVHVHVLVQVFCLLSRLTLSVAGSCAQARGLSIVHLLHTRSHDIPHIPDSSLS